MRREIASLNAMSFELPQGYSITEDKYDLVNGQGLINTENYLSEDGQVISLFEVHRDPDEFLESYRSLTEKYSSVTDRYELFLHSNIKIKDFIFPVFVIKGYHEKVIYNVQVFVNCGDRLGCFMITLKSFNENLRQLMRSEKLFADLVKLLRTVE